MIGRIYRPLKILSIPNKRGYKILNKYMSNFGGTNKFTLDVYLNYNVKEKSETIQMDFYDMDIPILVRQFKFAVDPLVGTYEKTIKEENSKKTVYGIEDNNKVLFTDKKKTIKTLRKISRPTDISSKNAQAEDNLLINQTDISSKNSLSFTQLITSAKDEKENDVLVVELYLDVVKNIEYLVVEVICKTPVIVNSEKSEVKKDRR
ncbi:MAG: hypothetical protein K0R54_43 [Clostridiaceae bacterium]|jgi:hypothetical protein|nr:hypothetical protein [Clostridiaceae bacterium]